MYNSAMKLLISVIKKSKANTWMELEKELRKSIEELLSLINTQPIDGQSSNKEDLTTCKHTTPEKSINLRGRSSISLASGCELFMRYATSTFRMIDGVRGEIVFIYLR